MGFREKVRAANKKREDANVKREDIQRAAIKALAWWDATNTQADTAMANAILELDRVQKGELGAWEWLSVCPARWVRRVAAWWKFKCDASALAKAYEKFGQESEVWSVMRILGGQKQMSLEEIRQDVGTSEVRMHEIMAEINAIMRKQNQTKPVNVIVRNPRPSPHMKG